MWAKWFGREGGGFVVAVRFTEDAEANTQPVKPVGGREQMALG
jgi:hypothetical protein